MVDATRFNMLVTNLTNFTTALNGGYTAEKTNVRPKEFWRKGNKDPYEWLEQFENAYTANNWGDNRRITHAGVYLQGPAKTWFNQTNTATPFTQFQDGVGHGIISFSTLFKNKYAGRSVKNT